MLEDTWLPGCHTLTVHCPKKFCKKHPGTSRHQFDGVVPMSIASLADAPPSRAILLLLVEQFQI
eukprot:scaffold81752_cov35-Prasinocladus_malaysianus.AAC.1